MAKRKINWKLYLFEFLSVFFGVTLAFALNKWNEDRKDIRSEIKILTEIRNGLKLDLYDFNENIDGHNLGIKACEYFRRVINNEEFDQDSFQIHYFILLRDFISVQNKTGYESLKSKGLELVRNDSLRHNIIALYDFHFEIIEKLEESYSENQFNENYYKPINDKLSRHFNFLENGEFGGLDTPVQLSEKERKNLMSYLLRIENNRSFLLIYYNDVKQKIQDLIKQIDAEI
jgi:hypothetical protein